MYTLILDMLEFNVCSMSNYEAKGYMCIKYLKVKASTHIPTHIKTAFTSCLPVVELLLQHKNTIEQCC